MGNRTETALRILYTAELVGKAGIYALKKILPELKKSRRIDFTLVCADGATGGGGLGRSHAAYIRKLGADVITTGDCAFYKKDLVEQWHKLPYVLRPINLNVNWPAGFGGSTGALAAGDGEGTGTAGGAAADTGPGKPPDAVPGFGWRVFRIAGPKDTGPQGKAAPPGAVRAAAAVLLGSNFNRLRANNPFNGLDSLLKKLRAETPFVILDFHSWASGEKRTLFAAAAGQCTAVIGSHNRVQTADEGILNGTAVICDAGRTGSAESVGGTASAARIREYLSGIPQWKEEAWDKCEFQGVLIEADKNGRALSIERIRIPVPAKPVQN